MVLVVSEAETDYPEQPWLYVLRPLTVPQYSNVQQHSHNAVPTPTLRRTDSCQTGGVELENRRRYGGRGVEVGGVKKLFMSLRCGSPKVCKHNIQHVMRFMFTKTTTYASDEELLLKLDGLLAR
jgi:hypothetical protein